MREFYLTSFLLFTSSFQLVSTRKGDRNGDWKLFEKHLYNFETLLEIFLLRNQGRFTTTADTFLLLQKIDRSIPLDVNSKLVPYQFSPSSILITLPRTARNTVEARIHLDRGSVT